MKCSWCKEEFEEAHYPMVHDFFLDFETGTTSEDFGPNIEGYRVETLCLMCAWKLKYHMEAMGIEVKSFET